jgi:hypothetical protein
MSASRARRVTGHGRAPDDGGRGGRRYSKARLAPSRTACSDLALPRPGSVADRQPPQLLGANNVGAHMAVTTGGALCRPSCGPSTGVSAVMGRERPRLCVADVAPEPSRGVAHAPHVSVDDVLGRVCEVRVESHRERRAFPTKRHQGIDADSVPQSASLLPLSRTHSAGCASTARWCQRFAIHRDTGAGKSCVRSSHSFLHADAHSSRTPDAPDQNSAGAMALVKASLLASALSRP